MATSIRTSYHTAAGATVHREVYAAIKAAAIRRQCGNYAARQHYLKLSGNANLHYYRLACQLQATSIN